MIVPATEARAIAGGRKSMHVIPFRDDPTAGRKLQVGARLPVIPQVRREGRIVSAESLCRVVLREVEFRRLGDLGFDEARGCGFVTTDAFRTAWVARHDRGWAQRCEDRNGEGPLPIGGSTMDAEYLARFIANHADRMVWVLRFEIDKTHRPRLLAARSDELYTDNPARALRGESAAEAVDAVTLEEFAKDNHERHAARRSGVADELLSEYASEAARLAAAVRLANERGVDVRDELRVVSRRVDAIVRRIKDQRRAA